LKWQTNSKTRYSIFKQIPNYNIEIPKKSRSGPVCHLAFGDWDLFESCFLDIVICLPHIQIAKEPGTGMHVSAPMAPQIWT
jgi:hypothetical protein